MNRLRLVHAGSASILTMFLTASFASAAAFTNGSFETGPDPGASFATLYTGDTQISGWTVTGNSVDYIGPYWTSQDGSRSLDLDGDAPGGVQQTFDTTTGVLYRVTFWLAGNAECGATIKTVSVSATGTPAQIYSFDISGHSYASMGWVQRTYDFVATTTSTTLSFASTDPSGSCGPALDNVAVAQVDPIPATSRGGAAGLALVVVTIGVGILVRRRLA